MKGCLKLFLDTTIGLILLLPFLWLLHYLIENKPEVENPKYTYGVITRIYALAKGSAAEIMFEVDGETYRTSRSRGAYITNVIGEKYIVKYEDKDPSINEVVLSKPLFLENESTSITSGYVRYYMFWAFFGNTLTVSCEYYVDNETYIKQQDFPVEYMKTFDAENSIRKNQKFQVEYWDENPNRAIIHLDKPVDE